MNAPAPDHPPHAVSQVSGLNRLLRLARKELRETLRDRRTIITLVLMPLLVYPLLSIVFHQFLLSGASNNSVPEAEDFWGVGVASEEDYNTLSDLLKRAQIVAAKRPQPASGTLPSEATVETQLGSAGDPKEVRSYHDSDYLQRLRTMDVDVAVEFRYEPTKEGNLLTGAIIHFRPDSLRSKRAADFLQRRFRVLNEKWFNEKLVAAKLPTDPPLHINLRPTTGEAGGVLSLAALIPVVLVLMTVTGAVYPAIDLTAGERERNTLECLIAAPITRIQLLLAKYVAVLTVALLTAGVNLLGMLITIRTTGLGAKLLGSGVFTPSTISAILALLVLFAAFYSAVLLAITSFARSFKEAQAYLIPLMLLSLGPALASLMPGLKLGPLTAVLPLVNVVLLARDLLGQEGNQLDLAYAGIAVVSTLVYAAAALTLAARVFGSDSILYGSEQSWGDLFRRPTKPSDEPSPSMLAGCLALLFPLYVLLGGAVGQLKELDLSTRLLLNAALTFALFAWLPGQFAMLRNVRLRGAFAWRPAPVLTFIGAAILGLSLWPIAHELVLLSQQMGLANLTRERMAEAGELATKFRQLSPALILACLALTPAVCEELFFRGFLLSAVRRYVDAAAGIAISAVVFGLFHVLAGHLLTPERLLPSAFLGAFLAWIAWRTRSVIPGIVMHSVNNGLLLLVALYSPQLEAAYGIGALETQHLPATWLAGSVVGAAVGVALVWFGTANNAPASVPAA